MGQWRPTTSRPADLSEGHPSWLTTSTGRPCQVLTPGLIHHLSDTSLTGLSPPPLATDHWPVWFVCDSCLHPIRSVRWYDFGPLRVVSGGLFVGPFFLCDLTSVVLINVKSSVTCTSLIYILWHVANLLLSFYLRLSLPIGINFSMWDFFFTWDCKFLSFYLDLSIIINYYTFLVITVYIFFSTLYIKWIGWNLFLIKVQFY